MAHPGWRRDTATFAAGAACGFLGGAFLVSAIVWQYGNVIGGRTTRTEPPPSPVARWDAGMDDAGSPVIEQAEEPVRPPPVVAPSPASSAAQPPAGDAANASPAGSPGELANRDLVMPVEGVDRDQLTRQFSDRRGASREHEAIDILAPRNTPVKAVEAGRIARLFFSKAGGITIYQFDPTERYCYYYAHLERYAEGLKEGDQVGQGQVIGYVGTTGNAPANTPHLHFAVFRLTAEKHWWEGTPIDPYDILHR